MRLLGTDATDDEVLDLCRLWIELVATDRVEEAIDLLWVPPHYDESQHWTADSLQTYIENYGSWSPMVDGSKWRLTSMQTAMVPDRHAGSRPSADLIRYRDDPHGGTAWLDVPLNGEWSDLTAQFEFGSVPGGTAVSLYDLHVL